jgi:hypothetical protein
MGDPFAGWSDSSWTMLGVCLFVGWIFVFVVLPVLAIGVCGYIVYLALIGAGVL